MRRVTTIGLALTTVLSSLLVVTSPVVAGSATREATSQLGAGAPAETLASTGNTFCVALPSGAVECWGDNAEGQLGDGTTEDSSTPVTVEGINGVGTLQDVRSVVGGDATFCAVLTTGGVDCWGNAYQGALGNGGDGQPSFSATPVAVKGVGDTGRLGGVLRLTSYSRLSCALLSSGGVDCWGPGFQGELGNGHYGDADVPVAVRGRGGYGTLAGVTALAISTGTMCALLTSAAVDCWGSGIDGGLGHGGTADSALPEAVRGIGGSGKLAGVDDIVGDVGGDPTTCAILTTGGVDCWGYGADGELGDGSTENSATPLAVEGRHGSGALENVGGLSGGDGTLCAALTTGRVDCWGSDYDGDLGANGPGNRSTPVAVRGVGGTGQLRTAQSVIAGTLTLCALLTSGGLDCWGSGEQGELGDGRAANSPTPVAVEGVNGVGLLSGAQSLAAAEGALCAVLDSDAVDCWGEGTDGDLGDGATSTSLTPVSVQGIPS